ncbi:MAG: nucleotidyltransferase family protein [Clostridia bacterium]|nr:nucleotidyltransferase family protein [Clostridia bacterium]
MKICALIAEYNPFHNGHLKHIEYIKNTLKADRIIVLMSGNFTQRGDIAVIDKFSRAECAIKAGADLVMELPTVFATNNAEIFAKGSISLLNSLNCIDTLCFGVESGEKADYISLANSLNDESKEFKKILKDNLNEGNSLAKAKFLTLKNLNKDFDESLVSSPNNILGLEYTRAILSSNSKIDIVPMIRKGNHNDITFKGEITSASSIREIIKTGKIKKLKKCMPRYSFEKIKEYPFEFDKLVISKLITTSSLSLSKITDCTEGLENRIKALSKNYCNIEDLVENVSTKRYTKTRIRRILVNNFLGISDSFVKECLKNKLYVKALAVNSENKDIISIVSKNSDIPVLTRKSDSLYLKDTAKNCFEIDCVANELYNLITNEKNNEHFLLMV